MEAKKNKSAFRTRIVRSQYLTYCLMVLSILLIPALLALRVDAEVAVFFSDTLIEEELLIDVSEENGKKFIERERRWSNFQGSVPEDVEVSTIVLRLGWTVGPLSLEEPATSTADGTQAPEPGVVDGANPDPEVLGENMSSSKEEEPVNTSEESSNPEAHEVIVTEPTPEEASASDDVETETLPEEDIEAEPASEATDTFEQVSRAETFYLANAQIEGESDSSTPVVVDEEQEQIEILPPPVEVADEEELEQLPEVDEVGEIVEEAEVIEGTLEDSVVTPATSTELTTNSVTSSSSTTSVDMLTVMYTIDGETWIPLGEVNYSLEKNAVFVFSDIRVEEIPLVQVAIRYTVAEEDQMKIYFDSVRLEVEYLAPLVVIPIAEEIVNDQEPNFNISTIKTDVQSENIRVVILERGGMLEFWYSVTERDSGEVSWQRIQGGGGIDAVAPIAIKERIIFWIDRNQQTFFGFSVDEQSIFAIPFVNPEEKSFLLPFQNDDAEKWQATFDSIDNTFKFERIRTSSS